MSTGRGVVSGLLGRRRDPRDWREVEFVALDFEATSANPRRAEPLSVGWVTITDGRVHFRAAGYHLVAHAGDVPAEGQAIHRLLVEDLTDGDEPTRLAERLRTAVANRVLVAHGASLERALLRRLGVDHGPVVDTLALVRRLDERDATVATNLSLAAVAGRLGVPSLRAHHAFGDALTTALVLVVLAGRLERQRAGCPVEDLVHLGRP